MAPDSDAPETREAVARRSPRYGRFMLLGAVVFVIVAAIVTYAFPAQRGVDRNAVFGLVGVFAAAFGIAVGGVVALILDRAARRREGTVRLAREAAPAVPSEELVEFPVIETEHPDATDAASEPGATDASSGPGATDGHPGLDDPRA